MDEIYHENLWRSDWHNPKIWEFVEDEFIRKAKERWVHPYQVWRLAGDWPSLHRPIVEWFRYTYWKHNQKRLKEELGSEMLRHCSVLLALICLTGTHTEPVKDSEERDDQVDSKRGWKSVVGLE